MNKIRLLVVIALIVSLPAEVHGAQAIDKPSVPEFTLKYVDYSYDYYVPLKQLPK